MSLFDPILEKLGIVESDDEEGDYRCIRCGAYHDRPFDSCPDCGGSFVVPVDEADADEDA